MKGVAVGVGCRSGITAVPIVALVREALGLATLSPKDVSLFTIDAKRNEAGLARAASELGIPLHFVSRDVLAATMTATQSAQSLAAFGVSSVAESAAIVGAGEGSILIVSRIARDGVTCAVARAS